MLANVDLTLAMNKETYRRELINHQVILTKLAFRVYMDQRPVVILFEGWDAAGKGGAIKRLTEKMDPRGYVVYPIAAPQGDDKTHHYLWRFWRRLPEAGQIAVFDRSWYGRVMVERVEGFCTEAEWMRAFREINQFERQLVDYGTIVLKFWLQISKDEQLKRFEERASDKLRSWKLTEEDWRNRDKWELYEAAVNDMLLKTSTIHAPWTVVEGNSKNYARVKVLQTIVRKLSEELNFNPESEKPHHPKEMNKKLSRNRNHND